MAIYHCAVTSYNLGLNSPVGPAAYENMIQVTGDFGLAYLHFVPDGGTLGANRRLAGQHVYDVYFWMSEWAPIVDILRNEEHITMFYDDADNTAVFRAGTEPVGELAVPHRH